MFFFLGVAAVFLRSDLDVPATIARFLSLYLLMAIGFKGGVALAETDLTATVWQALLAALLLATIFPIYVFYAMRSRMPVADAAAVAATYGSISAVTFVVATSYLDANGISWSGYMVAAMALMESPAIIVGILLYRTYRTTGNNAGGVRWKELLRESCLNGSVLLILGSLVIGWISGPRGMAQVSPLFNELFVGMLCLFLLDMGLVAARRLQDLGDGPQSGKASPAFMIAAALIIPPINALFAGLVAWMLGLPEGDALLLTILGASGSYIAVPAAMRLALPESNPSVYLPMSLAVTFPFNLLIGIPLYHQLLQMLLKA